MSNPRVALIVLVLLALLFIVGMSLGLLDKDGGKIDPESSWIKSLQSSLGGESRVSLRTLDFSADCQQRGKAGKLSIPRSRTCTITIPRSDKASRRLDLSVQRSRVSIKLTQPGSLTDRRKLNQEEVELYLFEQGGSLLIRCLQGSGSPPVCTVELG